MPSTTPSPHLNDNQKKAVEYNQCPLLIVAGAGTGKTFTLVEKIKYLILNKLAKPEEILCLTFTEKAAYEMEERVDQALPYGYFQMWISTFHSFADDILKQEISQIGLNPGYKLMTQAETILFLRKRLFKLDLKYFRPLGNPNKFMEGMIQHFSRLRDEDISPEDYKEWAMKQSNNETMEKEDLEKYLELANAYEAYQKLKIEESYFDFNDLIYYQTQLYRKRPNILKEHREQFKYVLVDEFQDTNISQYELIKLLCPADKNPHLTVVGDDSQAIYKFRGASISNILTFMKDYPQAMQVTLNNNYRSNQTILDLSHQLIKNNDPDTLEAQLGISKKLTATKKFVAVIPSEVEGSRYNLTTDDSGISRSRLTAQNDVKNKKKNNDGVTFLLTEKVENEAEEVVKTILQLKKSENRKYSDFAILVRANKHAEPFINAFLRLGIPYQFLGPGRLYKQPEIKDLISYLKMLTNLEESTSCYRVFTMDIFQIDRQDISLLLSFAKKISLGLYQATEIYLSFFHEEWYRSEYQAYKQHLPLLKEETRTKLINIISMIKRHIRRIKTDTPGQVLYLFLEDSGLLKTMTSYTTEKEENIVKNITKFFNKIKTFENEHEDASVLTFTDYLDMSMELGESPIAGDIDIALGNAVNVLTVHSAKGLEFPVVFLVNLTRGRFPTNKKSEAIPLPQQLIKEILPQGDYHLQEERRLFYVGLTRAMDKAYMTASKFYGERKREQRLSPFVLETLGEERVKNIQLLKQEQEDQLSIFDFKKVEQPVIQEKFPIKNFSYSQLESYDMCPLQYKYQYILRIPTQPNAAASFGDSIHKSLQKFYQVYLEDKTIGVEQLLTIFDELWVPLGYSSLGHMEKMKNEGKKMLKKYYETFHNTEITILALEKLFKIKIDDEVFITGKIDRVDRKVDGAIEIIDYKTGKKPSEKELKKSLQLSIYALAATDNGLYRKSINQVTLTFYYLQDLEKISAQRTIE